MSVTTTFDNKIQDAKDNLSSAYKNLLVCLDEDTWGHSDISSEYMKAVHEAAMKIYEIRNKL